MLRMPRFPYAILPLALLLLACSQAKEPASAPSQTDSIKDGYELIDSGHPEEAINLFDRALTATPNNAAAYNGKGVAFDHAGNHLAAQELYQHALSLEPDSLPIRNNLAMSLILNGQIDEATSLLEELNHQFGGSKIVKQNLALAYGIKGNDKAALELNMQDLPANQAQENMRFYKLYAQHLKSLKMPGSHHTLIGFMPTPELLAHAKRIPAHTAADAHTAKPNLAEPHPDAAADNAKSSAPAPDNDTPSYPTTRRPITL